MEIIVVDVDDLYDNFDIINEKAVKLNVNAALEVFFNTSGNIERENGNFIISTMTSEHRPIVSFSKSSHSLFSKYGIEVLVVNLESSYPTHLPPKELHLLKELLATGFYMFKLDIVFKWNINWGLPYIISPQDGAVLVFKKTKKIGLVSGLFENPNRKNRTATY